MVIQLGVKPEMENEDGTSLKQFEVRKSGEPLVGGSRTRLKTSDLKKNKNRFCLTRVVPRTLIQILLLLFILSFLVDLPYVVVPRHFSKLNSTVLKLLLGIFEICTSAYMAFYVCYHYIKCVMKESLVTDTYLAENNLLEGPTDSIRQDTKESTATYCSKCRKRV